MPGVDVYPTFDFVRSEIKKGVYVDPRKVNSGFLASDSEEIKKLNMDSKWSFLYSEFALVVHEMDIDFGREKLAKLIRQIGKGTNFYTIFEQIYGADFDSYWFAILSRIKLKS